MASSTTWLSLTDLSRNLRISAIHCGLALQQKGWRDRHGRPTQKAFEAGAASTSGPHNQSKNALWNKEICKVLIEQAGYNPISHITQVEQWTQLLEALEEGSPSIKTTPAEMAEELPIDLVEEVNDQLAKRGCQFRVKENSNSHICEAYI